MKPLFFFGTLTDRNVLGRVIGRPVAARELVPGLLEGFVRVQVVGASYPVLEARAGAVVDGVLFQPTAASERARIDHFESEEYAPDAVCVLRGSVSVDALCYLPLAGVFQTTDQPWELAPWQARHMPDYLRQCDRWMADWRPVDAGD